MTIAVAIIIYGFWRALFRCGCSRSARLPEHLRELGVIAMLAVGILWSGPIWKMPAFTALPMAMAGICRKIFPSASSIACGASRAFHALISSGTTPRCWAREPHALPVGDGSMLLESFVAIMAMVASCALKPGVYFAVNSPPHCRSGRRQPLPHNSAGAFRFRPRDGGVAITSGVDAFNRTGGAPSLASAWPISRAERAAPGFSASGITSPSCSRRCLS